MSLSALLPVLREQPSYQNMLASLRAQRRPWVVGPGSSEKAYLLAALGDSLHLTDRGAEAMSPDDPGLWLVPDISEEIHRIDKDPDLSPHDRIERRRRCRRT